MILHKETSTYVQRLEVRKAHSPDPLHTPDPTIILETNFLKEQESALMEQFTEFRKLPSFGKFLIKVQV